MRGLPVPPGRQAYEHQRALDVTERFFWTLCDDYIELTKDRAYAQGVPALGRTLGVTLRLFAPFLPFVTEEVWSATREGSIHRAPWPSAGELPSGGDPGVLTVASGVLRAVRGAKSAAKLSPRAEAKRVVVRDAPDRLERLELARRDLVAAGHVASLELEASDEASVSVQLT